MQITSQVTHETTKLDFGLLYFGDHNLACGVRESTGADEYEAAAQNLLGTFAEADLPGVLRLLDSEFGGATHSLKSLFRDQQHKILTPILASVLAEAEGLSRPT